MKDLQLYAANLFSLDCEKSALLYAKIFSISIASLGKTHAELRSQTGLAIFFNSPSIHCQVTPGSISFAVPKLNLSELELEPLQMESYHDKEKYASFLDEYVNRIWIFEKR